MSVGASGSDLGRPVPRQKLVDALCGVVRQAAEYVGEPGAGIDVVELAGLDQGVDRRSAAATSVGAARTTAMAPRHIGAGLGFGDQDQSLGIEVELSVEPSLPALQDIAPILLGGVRCLFLRVIRRRSKNRHSVPIPTAMPRSASGACNSAGVMSSFALRALRMKSACASIRADR